MYVCLYTWISKVPELTARIHKATSLSMSFWVSSVASIVCVYWALHTSQEIFRGLAPVSRTWHCILVSWPRRQGSCILFIVFFSLYSLLSSTFLFTSLYRLNVKMMPPDQIAFAVLDILRSQKAHRIPLLHAPLKSFGSYLLTVMHLCPFSSYVQHLLMLRKHHLTIYVSCPPICNASVMVQWKSATESCIYYPQLQWTVVCRGSSF